MYLDEILRVWLTSKINRIYSTRLRTQANLFRASAIQSSLLFPCTFLSGGHMSLVYLTQQCRRKRKLRMYKHLCKARGSALPIDSSRFATKSPVVFHRSRRVASWNFCHCSTKHIKDRKVFCSFKRQKRGSEISTKCRNKNRIKISIFIY